MCDFETDLSGIQCVDGKYTATMSSGKEIKIGDSIKFKMHTSSNLEFLATVVDITKNGIKVLEDGEDIPILIDSYCIFSR